MIIHNPEITGSLIFPRTDGTRVVLEIDSLDIHWPLPDPLAVLVNILDLDLVTSRVFGTIM